MHEHIENNAVSSLETRRKAELILHWILVAILYPDARPGVVATVEQAAEAMKTLWRRARFEALLRNCRDPDVPEDAVNEMLAVLAESDLLENFRRVRGTPRDYLEGILRRFVWKIIHRGRRQAAGPLPDGLVAAGPGPAEIAETDDLERTFQVRLKDLPAADAGRPPAPSAAARYARVLRDSRKRWAILSPFLPGVTRRPKRRRPA